jgi:hypothetical protein
VELFICVFTNSRGLKGASSRRQNVLTGQDAKTPYASKKKEAYGAPEAFAAPSILSSYVETELLFFSWLIIDDVMADDEEPLEPKP